MTEFKNASQHAKVFYARHMFPGTVEYHDERILVDEQAANKMMPTFKGKPVYVNHQNVDLAKLSQADGFISDSFKNGVDAWSWVKFVAITDAAIDAIENKNYAVSNAWMPKTWEPHAGTFHNVKYDRRIRDAEYTHLALVPDPRYEESKVFTEAQYHAYVKDMRSNHEMHNSKGKRMFKFWNTKKEEITADEADLTNLDSITLQDTDGTEYSVAEMLNAVKADNQAKADKVAADAAAEAEKTNTVDILAHKIDVDGVEMTVAELQEKFNALQTEQKATADKLAADEQAATDAATVAKKIADDAAAKTDELAQKNFDELQNARDRGAVSVQIVETTEDRVKRGQDRYGSNS